MRGRFAPSARSLRPTLLELAVSCRRVCVCAMDMSPRFRDVVAALSGTPMDVPFGSGNTAVPPMPLEALNAPAASARLWHFAHGPAPLHLGTLPLITSRHLIGIRHRFRKCLLFTGPCTT